MNTCFYEIEQVLSRRNDKENLKHKSFLDHDYTCNYKLETRIIEKNQFLFFFLFLCSTNIVVEATLQHDENSTALATNASVMFYIPPYMVHTNVVVNTSTYSTSYENGIVIIEVSSF